ncbi:MAG: DUF5131 family protein [Lachnospiraceae bacterium]|jgi:protein gp37|nr:DUF5131 family protein [Lachnospiraceae bacterium]MCI9013559.1 DUF5131 family protein [Lachnospiraceae bacterium]MCI9253677.1 DUF5131 family protein [Lachnospiraceae bacterium]
MNRSKIGWCDHTWNPITGCRINCPYCYARTMTARFAGDIRLNLMAKTDYSVQEAPDGSGEIYILDKPMLNETGNHLVYPFGFEPTYHRYRMNTLDKLITGKNIFVGAMADIFAECIPDEWILDIINACINRPQHNYLFLTKNPQRYIRYGVPTEYHNMWYGTTITCGADVYKYGLLPADGRKFVSIEPILGPFNAMNIEYVCKSVDWVIIGAETGRRSGKVIPKSEWINAIVEEADRREVPVFMKESLAPVIGEENMRREFPERLKHFEISQKMRKKLFDSCAECRTYMKKSDMITLFAKSMRMEAPKNFGFMCKKCFKKFCENLELKVPELEALTGGDINEHDVEEERL